MQSCESKRLIPELGSERTSRKLAVKTLPRALDRAADYYLRMRSGTTAIPTRKVQQLMNVAKTKGALTPGEIAKILDTEELPVRCEMSSTVGQF